MKRGAFIIISKNAYPRQAHVEEVLKDLPGVIDATVKLGQGNARVQFIPEVVTITRMERVVYDAGYEALRQDPDDILFDHEQNTRKGETAYPDGDQKAAGLFAWIRKAFK